ncbi:MAG: chemotaxis protein CheW [Synergistaceae bacterium]|nr:chemotaxis protein CheW [Synergistaceae bacterium]
MNMDELLQDFVDEAKVHIERVENMFLDIDGLKKSKESINDVFRAMHSIKGTAGFFQLKTIVSLSHAMENVLGKIRSESMELADNVADCLLSCNDVLKDMIFNVRESEKTDISGCLAQLEAILNQGGQVGSIENKKSTPLPRIEQPVRTEEAHNEPVKIITPVMSETEPLKIRVYNNDFPLAVIPASADVDVKFHDLLEKAVKRGHKIFKLAIPYENNIPEHIKNYDKFIENIREIGEIVDAFTDAGKTHNLDEIAQFLMNHDGERQIRVEILITSVLELELFCEALEIPPSWVLYIPPERVMKADGAAAAETNLPKKAESVRVNLGLLENLMSISGEMVLARNQLLTAFKNNYDFKMIGEIVQNIDNLTSKMQQEMMLTRMQPVSGLFNKFPRLIREMSKSLNKEMAIYIEDGDVELDKSMIEALSDPLIHLVRNSADHGIESPDRREKIGKPRKGTITLRAYHKSSYVTFEISDDGGGINWNEVRRRAVEKGFLTLEQSQNMSDKDAYKILFYPGFSNAKTVSDISGRGVGMDVVKKNVEKLGGVVDISSRLGTGTTITLTLPRTLAIVRSLIIETGMHRFAIPQTNVSHVIDLNKNGKETKVEHIHNAKEFRFRGKLLPVVDLSEILGFKRITVSNKVMVVVNVFEKQFGLLVDGVYDTEETLVKPVPSYLKSCVAYSGVTIMGDGSISMILDPEGIVKMADIFSEDVIDESEISTQDENAMLEHQHMMFFRCSGPELYAIDMNMVSRVELIKISDIQKIGDENYARVKGKTMKIIRPEDYLPVTGCDYECERLTVIIPKLVSNPMGILVKEIVDNVKANFALDIEQIKSRGIFGTVAYNEKIALILNIYELFEMADPVNHPVMKTELEIAKSVLIVEDTPFFQHVEAKYFEGVGCTVTIAQNGMEALEILKRRNFDAIISDLIMPVMDGFEFIRRVREDSRLRNVPAVAVTSMGTESYINKAIEYGFDAYEVKLNKETLIKTVCNAIKGEKRGMAE